MSQLHRPGLDPEEPDFTHEFFRKNIQLVIYPMLKTANVTAWPASPLRAASVVARRSGCPQGFKKPRVSHCLRGDDPAAPDTSSHRLPRRGALRPCNIRFPSGFGGWCSGVVVPGCRSGCRSSFPPSPPPSNPSGLPCERALSLLLAYDPLCHLFCWTPIDPGGKDHHEFCCRRESAGMRYAAGGLLPL
jgi:hypothetical protein